MSVIMNHQSSSVLSGLSNGNQICCLSVDGVRCQRIAGNASYSKRIQKTVQQKRLPLSIDSVARHVYICEHHKNEIQNVRTCFKRKRKDSCDESNGASNSNDASGYFNHVASTSISSGSYQDVGFGFPNADLSILQMSALRRYKKHYRIATKPGINKTQLSETLMQHFRQIRVDEKEVIAYFIYMVKCNANKLDRIKGLTNHQYYQQPVSD